MIRLFVDTSSKFITIGLIDDNGIISIYNEKQEKDLSTMLVNKIDSMLRDSDLTVKNIEEIYVVNGPGSFTGIRIGLTFCKVLAWSLNIKIIPISSLEFIASTPFEGDYIVPMIDARRDNVFAGIYDKNLNVIENDNFISFNDIVKSSLKFNNVVYISYDNFDSIDIDEPRPSIIKCIKKHINDEYINPHTLNPNYLKLTEAEENLIKNDKTSN